MIPCAYCEKPLICEVCGDEYLPRDAEDYASLSRLDVPVFCPGCEAPLICHWCQMPYDGGGPQESSDSASP